MRKKFELQENFDVHHAKKATKNVVYILISMGVSAISTFILLVIVGRFLGALEYGVFSTAWTLLVLTAGFCAGGLQYAILKYVPEYTAKEDAKSVKLVLATSYRLALLWSLVVGACLFASAELISEKIYNGGLTNIIRIVGLSLPINAFFAVLLASFIGLQKVEFHLLINSIGGFSKLAVVTFFVVATGAVGGILSITVGFLASIIIGIWFIGRITRITVADVFKLKSPLVSRRIIIYSLPIVISSISGLILKQGGILILGLLNTQTAIGLFMACFVLVSPLQLITGAVGVAMVPVFSELWAKDKKINAAKLQIVLIKFLSWIILPIIVVFTAVPDTILELVYGPEYLPAHNTLRLLACGSFILLLSSVFNSFLLGIGKSMSLLYITSSGAILLILFNTFLIPMLGVEGAGIAFLLSCMIQTVISIAYIKRFIRLRIVYRKLIGLLASGLLMFLTIITSRHFIPTHFGIAIGVLVGLAVFIVSLFLLKIVNRNDMYLISHLIGLNEKRLDSVLTLTENTRDNEHEKKRKRRKNTLILSLIILLLAVIGALKYQSFLGKLEEFLILDENPKQVDVIIVLSGAQGERVEYAVKLFKQSYSNKMIMSGGKCSWNSTSAEIMKEHAVYLGVSGEKIFTEKQATTTYENAEYSLDIMVSKGFESAIVVTSPTHTKRTSIIFNTFFKNRSASLTTCAVPDKTTSSKKWWQSDIGVQRITTEYMKLVYYYLFQRKQNDQIPIDV